MLETTEAIEAYAKYFNSIDHSGLIENLPLECSYLLLRYKHKQLLRPVLKSCLISGGDLTPC